MKTILETKIALLSSYIVGLILVLAPFWAFITVLSASGFGHYTAIRLIIEVLLLLVIIGAVSLLFFDKRLAKKLARQKWLWLLAAIVLLEIIWGLVSFFNGQVSPKALGYAWIVDLRYPLFFVAVYLIVNKSDWLASHWRKLVFIPALIVAVFAILQFAVLPISFLAHFGYDQQTIQPYETINHNKAFIRAMSFTRGANPLGAYMLVVLTLSASLLFGLRTRHALPEKVRRSLRRTDKYAFTHAHNPFAGVGLEKLGLWLLLVFCLAALVFSFSRSAWLGAVVSTILLIWVLATSWKAKKIMLASGTALVIILALGFASFHNNTRLQNYILHTQDNSTVKTNSNEGHLAALENSFDDFASDPLGDGPGTAGPSSIYNSEASVRVSENYYLMFALENGWLGMALLLAFFVLVALELFRRKSTLALALFTSLVGLLITNLFLPAWTDVTLAYLFWGLAGVALAAKAGKINVNERKANKRRPNKTD